MALYFITGNAGTGKTSVCNELKSRGYEAYDTDGDGFSKWQHNLDGHIHSKSTVKSKDRTPDFLNDHSWNIPREEVKLLAKTAEQKPIFLCGVANNAAELLDLFSRVFALSLDRDTLKQRIISRESGDWGKQPHELELTLKQHDQLENGYEKAGFIRIDASQSIDKVVDAILTSIS